MKVEMTTICEVKCAFIPKRCEDVDKETNIFD